MKIGNEGRKRIEKRKNNVVHTESIVSSFSVGLLYASFSLETPSISLKSDSSFRKFLLHL